eukprot:scaffold188_cov429-Prasinococcus_capsulatus_cf.AAC.14
MIGAHEDSKDSSVLYINRALCALQMRKYNDALEDAEAALNLILEGREGPGELASLAKDLHARAAKGTGMESRYYIKASAKYGGGDPLGAIADARAGLFLVVSGALPRRHSSLGHDSGLSGKAERTSNAWTPWLAARQRGPVPAPHEVYG